MKNMDDSCGDQFIIIMIFHCYYNCYYDLVTSPYR